MEKQQYASALPRVRSPPRGNGRPIYDVQSNAYPPNRSYSPSNYPQNNYSPNNYPPNNYRNRPLDLTRDVDDNYPPNPYSPSAPSSYPPNSYPSNNYPTRNPPPQTTISAVVATGGGGTTIIHYGPNSMPVTCPYCHHLISTNVENKATTKTHMIAVLLCLGCCWLCCCCPYCMDSCQGKDHYCPQCKAFLGSYTN